MISDYTTELPSPDLKWSVWLEWQDIDRSIFHVGKLASERGHSLHAWIDPDWLWNWAEWSPDGKRVALAGVSRGLRDKSSVDQYNEIRVYEMREGKPYLLSRFNSDYSFVWSPDSKKLCFNESSHRHLFLSIICTYIGDVETGRIRPLFTGFKYSIPHLVLAGDSIAKRTRNSRARKMLQKLPSFTPRCWSRDGAQIAGTITDIGIKQTYPQYSSPQDNELQLPAIVDIKTHKLTLLSKKQVSKILGFSPDGKKLYCLFDIKGHDPLTAAIPGWVELSGEKSYQQLKFPGYRLVSDEFSDTYLRSADGYDCSCEGFSLSRDGKLLTMWEEKNSGKNRTAARLTVWDITDHPKGLNALTLSDKKYAFMRDLYSPPMLSFSEDNRYVIIRSDVPAPLFKYEL